MEKEKGSPEPPPKRNRLEGVMTAEKKVSERTDEEVYSRAPVVVRLGAQEQVIVPLVFGESREWRKKFRGVVDRLGDGAFTFMKMDKADELPGLEEKAKDLLGLLVSDVWDEVAELVVDWVVRGGGDEAVIREWLDGAYEEQILDALWAIVQFAYPTKRLLQGGGLVKTVMGMAALARTVETATKPG